MLAAGCGGSDEPAGDSAADQLRPPPDGYRYADAPRPELQEQFERRVREDFGADDVALRNVYKGDKFVAGVVIARVAEPLSVQEVADKAVPGQKTRPLDVTFGERAAHTVTSLGGRESTTVIDTFGDFVLTVSAANGHTALIVADPLVR